MVQYDPEVAPDAAEWLAMDEQERILLVVAHHEAGKIELPDVNIHAVVHVVVENQLAERLESVVNAMNRMKREGLDRHDSLHAVGSVLAEHLFGALKFGDRGLPGTVQSRYEADLARLTARAWRKRYSGR